MIRISVHFSSLHHSDQFSHFERLLAGGASGRAGASRWWGGGDRGRRHERLVVCAVVECQCLFSQLNSAADIPQLGLSRPTAAPASAAAHIAGPSFSFAMVRPTLSLSARGTPHLSHAVLGCDCSQRTACSTLCIPFVSGSSQDPRQQQAVVQPLPLGEHHPHHHHPNGGLSEAEARENDRKAALASGYPPGTPSQVLFAAHRPLLRRLP